MSAASISHFQTDVPLADCTTFHVPAQTRFFAEFDSIQRLTELLQLADQQKIVRRMILGGGSNVLFTGNFDGLILRNRIGGIEVVGQDQDSIFVKVGAGENWHSFVDYCIKQNWAGVENLSLIPGSVGAAPIQNIGAYGVEVCQIIHSLQALDRRDHTLRTFAGDECRFGYRDSIFKRGSRERYVIINVTFRLHRQPCFNISYAPLQQELERMNPDKLSLQVVAQAVINIRSSKLPDPRQIGNAGSFFKNPILPTHQWAELKSAHPNIPSYPAGAAQTKVAAGWLIEQAGWKGWRHGDAGCYPKQALVLVNYGQARGQEILDLATQIIASVRAKFGITLEPEVNII